MAPGNYDFAAAFGNDLTANATLGSNMFVIEPSLFGDAAASAAAPTDDMSLSGLLADLSFLGW